MQFGRTYEEFTVGEVYKHWPGKPSRNTTTTSSAC